MQSTIRSILCLNHTQKCESLLISWIFGSGSPALNTSFSTWVLELNTHLFRSEIRGFQRWYNIKRKTSLSTNTTPMQHSIFAGTFDVEWTLNIQRSDCPAPFLGSFIYPLLPPPQSQRGNRDGHVSFHKFIFTGEYSSEYCCRPLVYVTCTTDFVPP